MAAPAEAAPVEVEKKLSKKELRILQRQQEQAAKTIASEDVDPSRWGVLPLIQSQEQTGRKWTRVVDLKPELSGQTVWVRARMHAVRAKGKCAFLVLRESCFTVQALIFQSDEIPKGMVKFASNITKESIVDIEATVSVPKQPIESCTQKEVELNVSKVFVACASSAELPFQLEDAMRPDPDFEIPDNVFVKVLQDTRLDNRVLDLRTPANNALMRLSSAVCQLFREFLLSKNFVEIHTPKIIGGTSEGGSSVFRLKYFDQDACLAQSPQLYKQMAVVSDLERVFEIGPVFRAENSNTHRHLCEFTGLDMEMAIYEHYFEVLDVMDEMFVHIFEGLNTRFRAELEAVRAQHPFEDLKYSKPTLRLTFKEGIQMLKEAGFNVAEDQDIDTVSEKNLGKLVKAKYGVDFFILHRYPVAARPFYTMPCPDDPAYTNSYDLFIRGEEIVSGAQRIHDAAFLAQRATECGIEVKTIQAYIDSFKYGAFPHGGCGVGLERVVMLFLGLSNVRKASMFPRDPKRLCP
eukprot:GILI01004974.1.p1 GENE.GILI01004974.1~~GILI01004974.1.p1  ORF type:complete len:520 (+),score=213.01 GILI01004974.1:73-1632(+)